MVRKQDYEEEFNRIINRIGNIGQAIWSDTDFTTKQVDRFYRDLKALKKHVLSIQSKIVRTKGKRSRRK